MIAWLLAVLAARPLLRFSAVARLNDLLSFVVNAFLCWMYPIKSDDGMKSLPTCRYRWPNGQGGVEKFLKGIENSELWQREHGCIYRIWSGMTPEVVLTRPEEVRIIFKDSDQHTKAANNNAGWLMGEVLGSCVGLISGTDWERLRTVTEGPFLPKGVAAYIPHIERRTKEHFDYLHLHGRLDQGIINPVKDLELLPFRIITEVLYGELSPTMENNLRKIIPVRERLFRHIIAGGLSRYWFSQWLPTMVNKDLSEFKKTWACFNENMLRESLAAKRCTPFVQMYRGAQSGQISLDELYQTLDEMLFANLDVTIGAISWNLVFLGESQDSQTDLRAEISSQRKDAQGSQNDWKRYLMTSTTLLAASTLESARLTPLAAFSVPQATPTDRFVGGFIVPAGTNFVIDTYALNVRNPYWGDHSKEYQPKRFLGRSMTETRYQYWRFGFGPRTCMGKYMADLILRIILTHLIENYRLELIGSGKDWDRNKETWITHPNTDVICERLMRVAPESTPR